MSKGDRSYTVEFKHILLLYLYSQNVCKLCFSLVSTFPWDTQELCWLAALRIPQRKIQVGKDLRGQLRA